MFARLLGVMAVVAVLGFAGPFASASELRIGVRSEPVSLDPHFSLQPPDMQFGRHFFDNLIFFDEIPSIHLDRFQQSADRSRDDDHHVGLNQTIEVLVHGGGTGQGKQDNEDQSQAD